MKGRNLENLLSKANRAGYRFAFKDSDVFMEHWKA